MQSALTKWAERAKRRLLWRAEGVDARCESVFLYFREEGLAQIVETRLLPFGERPERSLRGYRGP